MANDIDLWRDIEDVEKLIRWSIRDKDKILEKLYRKEHKKLMSNFQAVYINS